MKNKVFTLLSTTAFMLTNVHGAYAMEPLEDSKKPGVTTAQPKKGNGGFGEVFRGKLTKTNTGRPSLPMPAPSMTAEQKSASPPVQQFVELSLNEKNPTQSITTPPYSAASFIENYVKAWIKKDNVAINEVNQSLQAHLTG